MKTLHSYFGYSFTVFPQWHRRVYTLPNPQKTIKVSETTDQKKVWYVYSFRD